MSLLGDLSNVDPRDPGHWSTRISVLMACVVFTLTTALGMQARVRSQTLPQLANARAALQESLQGLKAARLSNDQAGRIRRELERVSERLRQFATWIPTRSEAMDLAVSLADVSADSPIREVRPWHPAGELARPLPFVGGEIEVSADYAEIIQFLDLTLAHGPLREMEEIEIGSAAGTNRLRATVRLLAYFGTERFAAIPRNAAGDVSRPAPSEPLQSELSSPFGPAPTIVETAVSGEASEEPALPRQVGTIRVGRTHYELVEDSSGNVRLKPGGP